MFAPEDYAGSGEDLERIEQAIAARIRDEPKNVRIDTCPSVLLPAYQIRSVNDSIVIMRSSNF